MTMTDWARRELAAHSMLPYPMTDAMFRLYTATMDEYDSGAAFAIASPGVVELVRRLMNSEPLTALDGGDDE